MTTTTRCVLGACLLALWACANDHEQIALSAPDAPRDSLPPTAASAQFLAGLPRRPVDLGADAARSRDELVARFVSAVEDSNAVALRALRLDIAEFGYLYYPPSRYTAPPYELPPDVLWMLIEQNGLKGEARALQDYGGRPLGVSGYRCEDHPRIEGPNRLWERCVLERSSDAGQHIEERLFGSIIEHAGRFKFVSIANRL